MHSPSGGAGSVAATEALALVAAVQRIAPPPAQLDGWVSPAAIAYEQRARDLARRLHEVHEALVRLAVRSAAGA